MKIRIFSFLFCMSVCGQCLAWGQTGHRITGAIAEQYLSDSTKQQIQAILPNESLAEASTWPDEMRSNPDEFWQKTANPWHYVTVPSGKTYTQVGAPAQGDALTALRKYTRVLKKTTSTVAEKQLALRFVVHIIADLHQPLHVGNGTDRGGNDRKVEFFWQGSNLHWVWDTGLIDRQKLSFTEWTNWLSRKITSQQAIAWQDTDPLVWIKESAELRDDLYPKDNTLSWQYQYDHLPAIKRRLSQAGVRIAAYLNEIYKKE